MKRFTTPRSLVATGFEHLVVPERLRASRAVDRAAREDLAAEEWMLAAAAKGSSLLASWTWTRPTVVLGYGQSVDDVDLEACRARGWPVLRRASGGTGIIHERDLAVSLALPRSHPWSRGVAELYERMLDAIAAAAGAQGLEVDRLDRPERPSASTRSPVCFLDRQLETLLFEGRKTVGCAQVRRREAVLVHAFIHAELDPAAYEAVFGVSEATIRAGLGAMPLDIDMAISSIEDQLADALGLRLEPVQASRAHDPWDDHRRCHLSV